jgi:uncharacterized protein YggU (UPF0235/DUF167 family)
MSEKAEFIKIRVYAGAKKNAIIKNGESGFKIFVKAKPQKGLANICALGLLSEKIGENQKKLKIIKGSRSPDKIVKVL